MSRMPIAKTIKMFIGGAFPRSESGRTFALPFHNNELTFANICQASRKDFRNSVSIAQKAQPGWQSKTAYNRSQILYRMAEMTESKREEFVETLVATAGLSPAKANKEVDDSIDAFVFYSGFADKYQALMGSINPVAGPHHNFTAVEPVGVVAHLSDENVSLHDLVSELAAIIVSGNAVVALLPKKQSALLAPLSEVFATSDLPGGVVNLLTGFIDELIEPIASHMEVHSVSFQREKCEHTEKLKILAAENMKRVVPKVKNRQSLDHLTRFVEYKTVWHPAGY